MQQSQLKQQIDHLCAAIQRGTVTEPYEALLAVANILRSQGLIDHDTAKTLIIGTQRLPSRVAQRRFQYGRCHTPIPPPSHVRATKVGLQQLQAEALGMACAIRRRDARHASDALAFFYAQMHEYGILTPHAALLQILFAPFVTIEAVDLALALLWDLALSNVLPDADQSQTSDQEESKP